MAYPKKVIRITYYSYFGNHKMYITYEFYVIPGLIMKIRPVAR